MHKDKVVIVTGGAGSIGIATVNKFLENGYKVSIIDKDEEKGKKFLKNLQNRGHGIERVIFLNFNISDSKNAETMAKITAKCFGRIDVLVNLAGNAIGYDILDIDDLNLKKNFETNIYTTFYCTKAVMPYMIKRGSGVIVNISSVNSITGIGEAAYSAAKAGVNSLTQTTAVRYGRNGIRCNCLCLGTIKTDSPAWQTRLKDDPKVFDKIAIKIPRKKVGTPEEVASLILFFASEESSLINGAVIVAEGGWTLACGTIKEKEGCWWED